MAGHEGVADWVVAKFVVLVLSITAIFCIAQGIWGPQRVWADSPAVNEFGQPMDVSAFQSARARENPAVFVTLYGDGHGQWEFHRVTNDAVTGFCGEHGPWRFDNALAAFFQMPVYVRDLSSRRIPVGDLGV